MQNERLHLKYDSAWYPPVNRLMIIKHNKKTRLSKNALNIVPSVTTKIIFNSDDIVISIPY